MISYITQEGITDTFSYNYLSEEEVERKVPMQLDVLEAFALLDINAQLNSSNSYSQTINEASYTDIIDKEILKITVTDVNKFIKANDCKPITNPSFFGPSGEPTPDGLLSNEIFGLTQFDRSGIFAYIDLVEYFIDPSCYKTLIRLDRRFKTIVHATQKYSLDKDGFLVEDPIHGGTGIKWLKNNFPKINLDRPGTAKSRRRDIKIKYLKLNYDKGVMFINKYIVIPPYYRDVNTSGKYTGVGQINTLYTNLIVAARSLKENNDYGMSMADTTCARIQETLRAIYDWFCGNDNPTLTDKGSGLSGKMGAIRRANMSKTADYSSLLVLSAPELKVESSDDLMVNLDRSAAPLAAVSADFFPFMMFHMRRFFENEFMNVTSYPAYINGKIEMIPLKNNAMQMFNDDNLKKQLKQFLYSYDNRFIPIEVPVDYEAAGVDPKKTKFYMAFKGTYRNEEYNRENPEPAIRRRLTWVDVIYIAAKKASEGKIMSFTRYPYDTFYNTIYTGIEISSTKETEHLYLNGEYYQFYPKIREEEILQPTGDKFVDTMQICNLYLKGMGADYDGDTGNMKGSFFNETNRELRNFANSKVNYINMNCTNIRVSANEAVQSIYNMTKVLYEDKDKLTDPVF